VCLGEGIGGADGYGTENPDTRAEVDAPSRAEVDAPRRSGTEAEVDSES
jgi:hypothetical protein